MSGNTDSACARLEAVRRRIERAVREAGRAPGSVALLAVSKTWPAEALRALAACGQRRFGENYAQEAEVKMAALADLDLEWHFIGPIQSNKTRFIAEHFHWVHSVDRLKIAQRLDAQRPAGTPPLNVCLQLNVSGESSKSGTTVEALPALAQAVAGLPRLRLRGLMAIPAPYDDVQGQRAAFHAVAKARAMLEDSGIVLDTLSMGMSADLEPAIAEGATMVRVGTALFGTRPARPA